MTTELEATKDSTDAPQTQECVQRYAPADREAISRHIDVLNREWDVERYLQMNAGGDCVLVWRAAPAPW